MKKTRGLFFYILLFIFLFQSATVVYAQNVPVLGEIQTAGKVFIGSSAGKWSPAARSYPLLQDIGIRTENGSASIFFKDGSRVDLSKDTIVSVNGEAPNFVMQLAKGVIAFSITQASSLSVSTPSASISINSSASIVQKVGYEKASRILGVITSTEKGTEVRSISGRIEVASTATAARTVSSGESLFVGADNSSKIYKAQATGNGNSNGNGNGNGQGYSRGNDPVNGVLAFGAALAVDGTVLVVVNDTWENHDSHHPSSPFKSPSGFR